MFLTIAVGVLGSPAPTTPASVSDSYVLGIPAVIWAGVVSGLVAIIVAALSQLTGFLIQKKSHANSLALFEKQRVAADETRRAEIEREDARREGERKEQRSERHLSVRRDVYARFFCTGADMRALGTQASAALKKGDKEVANVHLKARKELRSTWRSNLYELRMVGAPKVVSKAISWWRTELKQETWPQASTAARAFEVEARKDLGVDDPSVNIEEPDDLGPEPQ